MEKDTHHVSHNEGFLHFTGTSSCTSHFPQQIPNRARVPGINHLQQALDCTSNYKRSRVNSTEPEYYRYFTIQHHACTRLYRIMARKLEKCQKYCTRLIIHDEDDYDNRLSILKLSELNNHLQIFVFILFRKYNLMKIITAINTSLNNNPSIQPPSSNSSAFHKFT